ncbi:MAG: hypothetical protein EHM28_12860, partial [Spirochaetaceae bacterium]
MCSLRIKETIIFLSIVFFLINIAPIASTEPGDQTSQGATNTPLPAQPQEKNISLSELLVRIDEAVAKKDEEINIIEISLLMSKYLFPDSSMNETRMNLMKICREILPSVNAKASIQEKLREIKNYIFIKQGFRPAKSGPGISEYNELSIHSWLFQLFRDKTANCTSFTLLYIGILDSIGITCYPVVTPDHVFVRVKLQDSFINIEATNGELMFDSDYERILNAKKDNYYLRSLTRKEYIGCLLSNQLGFSLNLSGSYADALKCLEKALMFFPNFPDALVNKGISFRRLERPQEAISLYQEVLTRYPDNYRTLFNLGNAQSDAGRLSDAADTFSRVLAMNPEETEARVKRAHVLFSLKNEQEALAECRAILSRNPDTQAVFGLTATLLGNLGQHDEALVFYSKALASEDFGIFEKATLYSNMGNSLAVTGGFEKALAAYDEAIKLNQKYISPWLGKVNIFIQTDQIKKAQEALANANSIDASNSRMPYQRLLVNMSLNNVDQALADANEILKNDHGNIMYLWYRAMLQISIRQYSNAISDIKEIIRINPSMPGTRYMAAYVYLKKQEYSNALDQLFAAGSSAQQDPVIRGIEALVYAMNKMPDTAIEKASSIFSQANPIPAVAYAARGIALFQKGRYEEAISDFDNYIWISPQDIMLREVYTCRIEALKRSLEPAKQPSLDAQNIISRYIAAIGGEARLKSINSLVAEYTNKSKENLSWKTIVTMKKPDRYLYQSFKSSNPLLSGIDGKSGWYDGM